MWWMPMSSSPLLPEGITEDQAVALLRHLEWQADSFSVVVLFAEQTLAVSLLAWLGRHVELAPMTRREAPDQLLEAPESWLDECLCQLTAEPPPPGATWLLLQRHPHDKLWHQARRAFLMRLNERRFLLEKSSPRPLVVVLPVNFRLEAPQVMPDLWHVRAFSFELAARTERAAPAVVPSREQQEVSSAPGVPGHALSLWQSVQAKRGGTPWDEGVFLSLPRAACLELVALGRVAEARALSLQVLAESRRRLAANGAEPSEALRDVSVSLDNVGRVAQAQGQWQEAEQVYRESLEISRELLKRLGGTPEALRDVSVSLNNVGRVAQVQGQWQEAEQVYRESLEISRELLKRLGGTPEALRDVSVSLNMVGRVARAQGQWQEAEQVYRESLEIRRELLKRLGGTPEALDDLALVLLALADIPDLAQAPQWRAEALTLTQQLVLRFPDVPHYAQRLATLQAAHAKLQPEDDAQ
jgi:tetratricopeptide (TPR) repeat protein